MQDEYKRRVTSAERAVEAVRSGDRVWIHEGCATPEILVKALLKRARELRNVEINHMLTFGAADYTRPEYEGHFRHNGLFLGANVREAVVEGRADYTPIFLSEIEELFSSGALPLDVAFIQVSPPDEHGYVSLGVGIDCTLTAARCARYVIAEVNEQMPRTLGDTFLHISKISAIVETSHPLPELQCPPFSPLQRRIAENVASLVPNGATLQIGIGGIPDAVLSCLRDRRDLGIHSEMCSDGVIPLIEAGVITGERKTLHRGKVVAGFVLGTKKLFQFIHENPDLRVSSYVLHERSVCHRAERENGGHKFRHSGGSDRAGLRGFHWHETVQRIWRANRFRSWRGAFEGWKTDYRATFHLQGR